MDTAKQASEIVAEGERRMRELIGVAASAGEYEQAIRITEWAKTLSDLARSTQGEPRAASPASPVHSEASPASRLQRRTRSDKRSAGGSVKAKRKGRYPRFLRRNDSIVKIGWSKTERSEYEHKAPRRVVDLLAAALVAKSDNGRLITAADVMPILDPADGYEVPSYQAYLCLAWLKKEGLAVPEGRQGYIVGNPGSLVEEVARRWRELPAK